MGSLFPYAGEVISRGNFSDETNMGIEHINFHTPQFERKGFNAKLIRGITPTSPCIWETAVSALVLESRPQCDPSRAASALQRAMPCRDKMALNYQETP